VASESAPRSDATATPSPDLAVVVPVYDEAENVGTCLRRLHAEVRAPFRTLVVYDFDEDTSLPVARRVAEELGADVVLVKNRYGRGALNAIKTGLHAAETRFVVVTMADLSDPPAVIDDMLAEAERSGASLVCGSRYMAGGRQIGGPPLKPLLSRPAGLSLWHLTSLPTHDATNSFKLYGRDVLDAFEIESTGGFELGLELVVKAHFGGFRVSEVPTTWTDRSAGESRFRLVEWLPKYLRWYFLACRRSWLG